MRRPRLSLLGRFSLLSFLVIAALAVALGTVVGVRADQRFLREGERLARVLGQVAVQTHLRASDLERPLTPERLIELDAALRNRFVDEVGLKRVKLFDASGLILYSDAPELIGTRTESDELGVALAGSSFAEREQGLDETGRGVDLLEVYTPLDWDYDGRPEGALEVYLDYAPVAAAARADRRAIFVVIALGALLAYAVLFRIVARASRRLRRQALHDELTGLANRAQLHEVTEGNLRRELPCALLLIDLDRFKEVNDTLGHDHGDRVLVEVARRLREVVRRGDLLARLGGDEFAVLVTELPTRAAAAELAGRVHDALRRPLAVGGVAIELDASVGVALSPEHARDVTTLVQRADVAMYEAKRARSGIETYAPERDPHSPERLALAGELRHGIAAGELELHYQPKVALATGAVTGVEALVRWRHPARGLLGPAAFVGLAEATGTIAPLTRWVLDAALAQHAAWRAQGVHLPVAVNLAAQSVVDTTLPAMIADALARHEVAGDRLECEISEHTVIADGERARDVLGRIRALGVRLSLDDFGAGSASLAYLRRLPLDEVKIDRSFVMGMLEDAGDAVIVRSTIEMARNLDLAVVAEGVESAEVLADLAALRCDTAQGYFLSRPLPATELGSWLAARSAAAV